MPQSIEWLLALPFGLMGILVWITFLAAPFVFIWGLIKAIKARKREKERGEDYEARNY